MNWKEKLHAQFGGQSRFNIKREYLFTFIETEIIEKLIDTIPAEFNAQFDKNKKPRLVTFYLVEIKQQLRAKWLGKE